MVNNLLQSDHISPLLEGKTTSDTKLRDEACTAARQGPAAIAQAMMDLLPEDQGAFMTHTMRYSNANTISAPNPTREFLACGLEEKDFPKQEWTQKGYRRLTGFNEKLLRN